MAENLLECRDLVFRYSREGRQGETVLKDLTLSVPGGQFLAVLGHNGCGKSTLAKHLNGILLPTEGTVLVEGIDTRDDERIFDIRQKVGMVFQNPDNQIVATIVEEDVAFAPENLGVAPEKIRQRVNWALEQTGMASRRESATYQLSGGQKQRVAIAGVLAMGPDCIVLDEPTAMLDPHGRRRILATLRELNRAGMTVALITHYMDEAAQADRVVVMNDGEILMDDSPAAVFARVEELQAIGLDVPQTAELLYQLRREGIDCPEDALSVTDCVEALCGLLGEVER
ncbi:energy-coupling factor transporter ATPase [Bittarella massiliensis (ex Durand et al. 2017)]|uniref:energy-coupling factor transporter ATPase n=1 Tax=Bittarella massiliensis (ex Durand et al. 2017) TaxID=1720313 RepID=UPI001AA1876D|nr:energy-coupling factor transporter ATPase [Bittarella massiliensis (ex Durand et al. 2017)]MBO1680600.1 energy-coupling factor transporter ATPase [Bittarella massiliensis (ex Durand et al. 2017)]